MATGKSTMSADTTTLQEARDGSKAYLQSRLAAKDAAAPSQYTIPNIDISTSFSTSLSARQAVADQIRSACTNTGFFYITSHGVPESSRQGILTQAQRFYSTLSREQKDKLHVRSNDLGIGWEPSEYTSIAGDIETKEAFNFGYEASMDRSGGDGKYRNLDGSDHNANLWPSEEDLPGFKAGVSEYYSQVLDLARHMFRLFALSLGLEEKHFDHMTTHPGGIARLMYYPAPRAAATPSPPTSASTEDSDEQDEPIGLGAHSDYECFTLLLSSSVPGLEILLPSGHWHIASPPPNSFIVNVADFMMRWTNGVYKSTIHRVVNRGQETRYSVPFFFSVNYDEVVNTLETCLQEGEVSRWKPIKAGEYILERLKTTTKDGKGFEGNEDVF
jgi:isopenicillin N synthase-like dioxygenase